MKQTYDDAQIFKALADESRRILLDALFRKDGQTQIELGAHLNMTRFGVMKHLRILEDAGLITTEKAGREKHHYLNPIPIQQVYDRWVSKYAQHHVMQLIQLKQTAEAKMGDIKHRYQIFIQATPEKVWDSLINGDITSHYYFGTRVESNWQVGDAYRYVDPANDNFIMVDGVILAITPPHTLIQTFRAHWTADAQALGESKVTWQIEQVGDGCSVTLLHEGLSDLPFAHNIISGWSRILSSLKTYLETGQNLKI